MKITVVRGKEKEVEELDVLQAKYIAGYKLEVVFADGKKKVVDFSNFLLSKHLHPLYVKYKNINNFKKFKIIHGNINWNNYEMIFHLNDLYQGKI